MVSESVTTAQLLRLLSRRSEDLLGSAAPLMLANLNLVLDPLWIGVKVTHIAPIDNSEVPAYHKHLGLQHHHSYSFPNPHQHHPTITKNNNTTTATQLPSPPPRMKEPAPPSNICAPWQKDRAFPVQETSTSFLCHGRYPRLAAFIPPPIGSLEARSEDTRAEPEDLVAGRRPSGPSLKPLSLVSDHYNLERALNPFSLVSDHYNLDRALDPFSLVSDH
ncbi:unnamed protein product [Gadus morhua 'NCC']